MMIGNASCTTEQGFMEFWINFAFGMIVFAAVLVTAVYFVLRGRGEGE